MNNYSKLWSDLLYENSSVITHVDIPNYNKGYIVHEVPELHMEFRESRIYTYILINDRARYKVPKEIGREIIARFKAI